jgi:hypothetical protein
LSDGGVEKQATQLQQNETQILRWSEEPVLLRALFENSLHFGTQQLSVPLRV